MSVTKSKETDSSGGVSQVPYERKYAAKLSLLYFTLPQIGLLLLFTPTTILAGIYAKYFDLSFVELAGVTLSARIFDAVTDPLVGY